MTTSTKALTTLWHRGSRYIRLAWKYWVEVRGQITQTPYRPSSSSSWTSRRVMVARLKAASCQYWHRNQQIRSKLISLTPCSTLFLAPYCIPPGRRSIGIRASAGKEAHQPRDTPESIALCVTIKTIQFSKNWVKSWRTQMNISCKTHTSRTKWSKIKNCDATIKCNLQFLAILTALSRPKTQRITQNYKTRSITRKI